MKESLFIQEWKEQMIAQLQLAYENKLNVDNVNSLLNKLIEENIQNKTLKLFNNYRNTIYKSDILSLYDLIEKNHLIYSGGGCLFYPHDSGIRNLIYEFLQHIKQERNISKGERKNYPKGSDEWISKDIDQNNYKLTMNSWYGCTGYPGFTMYNVFLAEAITNQGRNIITACTSAFENYIGDGMVFTCEGELLTFIYNCTKEFYDNNYKSFIANLSLDIPRDNYRELLKERLINKCVFNKSALLISHLSNIIDNLDIDIVILLYYKNNLMEFNKVNFIKDKIKNIISINGNLVFGALKYFKSEIQDEVLELLDIYTKMVIYNYPTYDKVRKAMYTVKKKCLYTDTDSVFISLMEFVNYTLDLFKDNIPDGMDKDDLKHTGAFFNFYFVDMMVDKALKTMCKSQNIEDEHAKLLVIKNEFYYSRIIFANVKKRYLAKALYQEGNKIPPSEAVDIKGMDFKKATTNAYLKNIYTEISLNELLNVENINSAKIFKRMIELKKEIEDGIRSGDRRFFKQLVVKLPKHYKNPYSTQGVTATMLWNTLCPDLQIAIPGEIYVVPIKDMKFSKPTDGKVNTNTPLNNKNINEYSIKYPEEYSRLYKEIYCNYNAEIRHMSLNYIALPRNEEIKIPKHVVELIDFSKIIDDALALYLPVLNSIGLKNLPTTSTTTHMSNIIQL